MVYVYSKQSEINKYIGKNLKVEEIETALKDLGLDIKGVSQDKDPELKIELTAEKVDLVSTIGIARALKYYLGLEKKVPKYEIKKDNLKLIVDKSAEKSRPKTVAAIIRDINITQEVLDEMIKIQEKIHESFGRGRKKGAIGIYPLDKIEFPITYKSEKPKDIVFRPLESQIEMNAEEILEKHDTGRKYAHLLSMYEYYPVFRDNSGKILSMPPIINSHDTGRVETHHKDLFIECSGQNMSLLNTILTIIITTFIEMGGKAESMKVEYQSTKETYELKLDTYEDEIDITDVNKLIGINITTKEAEKLLNKMMYGVKEIKGNKIKVEIPCFRFDVWHDVDIADDIARAYGYNNIIPRTPNVSSVGETLKISDFKDRITQTMISLGYLELYTYILTSTENQFKNMNLDEKKFKYEKLIDSADEGTNMCRINILPENLKALLINRKNKYPQKIFENGFTIQVDEKTDTKAKNESHLCVSIADSKSNYTQIKNILDTIMKLNEIEFSIKEETYPFLIEGRSASIFVKGERVGFIGELHPQIIKNFGLLVPVSSFEINIEKIYELNNK